VNNLRKREEIESDKSSINKLILETLLDIRELLQDFDEEELKVLPEEDEETKNVKCGVSEDEIVALFEENCK
jgi:hypothetical protein